MFNVNNYRQRIVDDQIEKLLSVTGALCIEGPKWCGKTWTSMIHAKSSFNVGDPSNNFQNRELASLSPSSILEGNTPRLIDEWNEVPSLWDAVRSVIDERGKKGQFILTGSTTPILKGVLHSGAGRILTVRMHTMSLWESGDSSGQVSLKDICDDTFKNTIMIEKPTLDLLAFLIVRGGWPGNIGVSPENADKMPQSYLHTIIHNDMRKLDDIHYDLKKANLLLRSIARNESTTVSAKTLVNDITLHGDEQISVVTITKYLSTFERLFLLDNQLPFSPNIRSSLRVKQSEKLHFCDPALACAALNMTPNKLINNLETFGFLFEALVERDLKIYAESFGAKLLHYQDYRNNEIDAVIELDDGEWCAFEIKLGANQIDEAAQKLLSIKKTIERNQGKPPKVLCVISGLSFAAYKRPDGVYVVPITALKN